MRLAPLVCGLLLLAPGVLLSACDGGDDRDEGGHRLVDSHPVEGQRVTLADGTELALGSDGDDAFVAQWRSSGDDGWSAPETVTRGDHLDADALEVVVDGDTAVATFSWYAEDDDERESYARIDVAVCHARSCEPAREDVAGPAMVGAEGSFAAVLAEDDTLDYAVWRAGSDEWRTVTVSGPPLEPDGQLVPTEVVLLADGSFATVVARQTADGCTDELWQGEPEDTELRVVAATTPRPGASCIAESVETDGQKVSFYNRSIDQDVSFARHDGSWTDDEAASTPVAIDGDEGRSGITMLLTELSDGSSVAVGSPDLHRIVAQHRAAGAAEWSAPVTVARSPAGQSCRTARSSTLHDRTDVMYVVSCWPDATAWRPPEGATAPTAGVVLASADGRRWAAEPLVRPALEPDDQLSEPLLIARGGERSLTWRPGSRRFGVVSLPLAHPTFDGLAVSRGTAIRVAGNPDAARPCRPTWAVAPVGARSWQAGGAIRPVPAYAAGPSACSGVVIDREEIGVADRAGREFRVAAVLDDDTTTIAGVLVRTAAGWRLQPGG